MADFDREGYVPDPIDKTMLTDLQSCIEGVFKGLKMPAAILPHQETDFRIKLVELLFEQSMMHERTNMIAAQKKQTTEQIQTYKKANIKSMNKEGL